MEVSPDGGRVAVGPFQAEFVRVTHSIPDAVAVVLHTAHGTIVHTGDFKIDMTPVDGRPADLARLRALGDEGVALLLSDSTNAENPGRTASEATVGPTHAQDHRRGPRPGDRDLVRVADPPAAAGDRRGRVNGRKVCVIGRSMVRNLNISRNLGYAARGRGLLIKPRVLDSLLPHEVVVVCTGSQGEPRSALTRMATATIPRCRCTRPTP